MAASEEDEPDRGRRTSGKRTAKRSGGVRAGSRESESEAKRAARRVSAPRAMRYAAEQLQELLGPGPRIRLRGEADGGRLAGGCRGPGAGTRPRDHQRDGELPRDAGRGGRTGGVRAHPPLHPRPDRPRQVTAREARGPVRAGRDETATPRSRGEPVKGGTVTVVPQSGGTDVQGRRRRLRQSLRHPGSDSGSRPGHRRVRARVAWSASRSSRSTPASSWRAWTPTCASPRPATASTWRPGRKAPVPADRLVGEVTEGGVPRQEQGRALRRRGSGDRRPQGRRRGATREAEGARRRRRERPARRPARRRKE